MESPGIAHLLDLLESLKRSSGSRHPGVQLYQVWFCSSVHRYAQTGEWTSNLTKQGRSPSSSRKQLSEEGRSVSWWVRRTQTKYQCLHLWHQWHQGHAHGLSLETQETKCYLKWPLGIWYAPPFPPAKLPGPSWGNAAIHYHLLYMGLTEVSASQGCCGDYRDHCVQTLT